MPNNIHYHAPDKKCFSYCPTPALDDKWVQKSEFKRPTWDQYFLDIARAVSERAACTRSRVGAVLVKDNRIISTGYNGAPAGVKHCTDGGCPRGLLSYEDLPPNAQYDNCIAQHAEINCLAYSRNEARGGTMYITRAPCDWCSKVLNAFGIEKVVHP